MIGKLKKHKMLIQIFLVGMMATLVYRYLQSRGRADDLVPPQASETDRPLANGRMEFWQADTKLDKESMVGGNSEAAMSMAEALHEGIGGTSDVSVYCMINASNHVFLIRAKKTLDEDNVWALARDVVVAQAKSVPTVGVGVRKAEEYRLIIVGGPEEKPILVKYDGPFTLYPYFYRAEGLAAR